MPGVLRGVERLLAVLCQGGGNFFIKGMLYLNLNH